MTLQSLRKTVEHYRQLVGSTHIEAQQLERLKGLPFYNWSSTTVNNRRIDSESRSDMRLSESFNHAIGLPQKNGQPMPLFDYEQMLFDTLQSNKHVWIKKATGLGVTEFILRYMTWLSLQTKFANTQMCIVTGPRIELAVTLIDRMKGLIS